MTSLRTRPLPRPLPGAAPAPRTPGATWYRSAPKDGAYVYALERDNEVLAIVQMSDDGAQVGAELVAPIALSQAHHVAADVAALISWLSRGGR
jgi:hypothetical protein